MPTTKSIAEERGFCLPTYPPIAPQKCGTNVQKQIIAVENTKVRLRHKKTNLDGSF